MPDPSLLEKALVEACAFAIAHGVDSTITPAEFGIRPVPGGVIATYIDGDHAVTAIIDHHGHLTPAVAELFWTHDQGDEERDPCDYCAEGEPPMVDVYLPGDAPEEVAPCPAS